MSEPSRGLRATTLRGLSRTGAAHVGSSAVNLLSLAFAARYLEAEAFGTEAAASMLVGIWAIAADLGLGRAVVQRRDLTPGHVASALWGSLIFGGASALILWHTSGFWASLLMSDASAGGRGLTAILPWMGLGLAFASIGAVPRAMLERSFSFGSLAAVDFAAAAAGGLTLVVMSAGGHGVWSLVAWFLVRTGLLAIGPWILGPVRPRCPSWRHTQELMRVGGPWVGSQLAGYGQQNLDYLFIVRFLGVDALGYYSLAYRLVALAQIRLVPVILRVTFPAFSALQDDLQRLRRAFLTTIRYVGLLVFPMMAGFALLAEPGIQLLYGAGFEATAEALGRLAPGGAARGVSAVTGLIFLALGRTVTALVWALSSGAFTAVAIWLGISGGLKGVAVMMSVSGVVLTAASLALVGRMITLGPGRIMGALVPALVSSLAMAAAAEAALFGLARMGGVGTDPLFVVASGMASGGIAYGVAIRVFARATWREVRAMLSRGADAANE